ncbi:MAG: prepilin-type N-terminal cleavage/methylation domain-containing protein [Candidatus Binatia bacterium]
MERAKPEPNEDRGPTTIHRGDWAFPRYPLLLGVRRAKSWIGAKRGINQPYLIRREDGFTLNEILVALTLISIGILGFSLNTMSIIRGSYISKNVTTATYLAQDKIEQLKSLATLTDVDNCADPPEKEITAAGTPGGIYDRCWTIEGSPLGAGLRVITAIVRWRDYLSHKVTLATLVFTE